MIRKTPKIKPTKPINKKYSRSPILGFPMQKANQDKKTLSKQDTQREGYTAVQLKQATDLYLKFYKTGISLNNSLKFSLKVDRLRSQKQLGAFYLNGKRYLNTNEFKSLKVSGIRDFQTGVFRFTVKSSGLHKVNEYGIGGRNIAKQHYVDIMWAIPNNGDAETILYEAPIRFQCSCGRFTYWYRYIATKGGFCLGTQEKRFPKIRNEQLKGIMCKHLIRVVSHIPNSSFKLLFARTVDNIQNGKKTRVSSQDKVSLATSTFRRGK